MPRVTTRDVSIEIGAMTLHGRLRIPRSARGVILFAHASGTDRLSPPNTYLAERLAASRLAALLLDLLTTDEEKVDSVSAQIRFDIPLLTDRLIAATDWAQGHPQLENLAIGYFGAGTGATAALAAAARIPAIGAVVSRSGRPDLAGETLAEVRAPTLLIVGANDPEVLTLNRSALEQLTCEARLEIVPHATRSFVEPGALEQVASLAVGWFEAHLGAALPGARPTA